MSGQYIAGLGSQGVTGPGVGVQGVTGVRGMTGIQGVTGLVGSTGIQGITGLVGATGVAASTITGILEATGPSGFYLSFTNGVLSGATGTAWF